MSTVKDLYDDLAKLVEEGHGDAEVFILNTSSGCTDEDPTFGDPQTAGEVQDNFTDGAIVDTPRDTKVVMLYV